MLITHGVFQHQLRGTGLNRKVSEPDAPWGGSCPYNCHHIVFNWSNVLYSHCPPLFRVGLCGHKGALPCRGEHGPHRPTRTHTGCRRPEQPPNRPARMRAPRAHIQPLGGCPEPTEVMNPLQCVCVCEPRGGIARADALACWLCPHICRPCCSIDSVPVERPYTHRTQRRISPRLVRFSGMGSLSKRALVAPPAASAAG